MSSNGFVDVVTRPAGSHSLSVPGLGTFAPGAGPAIGADGTVVLGSLEGRVTALHADGTPFWNRQLPSETHHQILSSPAFGRDQSVYVVGAFNAVLRDHRSGAEPVPIHFASLYKFTAGGGAPVGNSTAFPEVRNGPVVGMYGPKFTGPPSAWQFGADEAVMVPAVYPNIGGEELHILAFSPAGGLMADVTVAEWNGGDVSGGWGALPFDFPHGALGPPAHAALPPLGIFVDPQAGTPIISVTNRFRNEIVHYRFCVGASCSPHPGFVELFRTQHAPYVLWSAPTTLPLDHQAVAGTDRGIVFSRLNSPAAPIAGPRAYAAPTVAADGRAVVVTIDKSVIGVQNHLMVSNLTIGGASAVQAAASRTHVYVSATDGFYTLDATAQTEVVKFPWVSGGSSPPAIGPDGRVYTMTSNILLIFPPPLRVRREGFTDVVERVG
jgi:hypothetical protein